MAPETTTVLGLGGVSMARQNASLRYIAFLRGINVGGHRVKMDQLRDLFTDLGYAEVSTFIASGNVMFRGPVGEAAAMEMKIEAQLGRSLGYRVDTFVRTPGELASVVAFRPFSPEEIEAPGHTLHVGFLRDAPSAEVEKTLLALRTEMDDFRLHGREMYWLCRGKTTDSLVKWRVVEKAVATPSTMRNATMLRKLAAICPAT